jgi:hypothetical protein
LANTPLAANAGFAPKAPERRRQVDEIAVRSS